MGKGNKFDDVVQLSAKDSKTFIEQASPLTRLHYFDGKFLRADAFALEQDYHRTRVRLANVAGGWGVINGFGIGINGNLLKVGAGLAVTAAGNFVLATDDFAADLAKLLTAATPSPLSGNSEFCNCNTNTATGVTEGTGLSIYEITVGPVEELCGNEAVFGKLCESACVSSSQHPYWRESVVPRLRPINLLLPTSTAVTFADKHLRNRITSAYFAAEPWLTRSELSAKGLASELWCKPASLYPRNEVVIGLLARSNGINEVIDAWGGRRERMDTQARGYWQGRMAMRPWNVFIAQILQFQCQLARIFVDTGGVISPPDDCDNLRALLDKTRKEIEELHTKYADSTRNILKNFGERVNRKDALALADQVQLSYADLYGISSELNKYKFGSGVRSKNRWLINAGFVELPPAGYLPVNSGKQDVKEQLDRFFGEGVRLHCHAVRHDEIAHLVEEAQHMDRISLTRGLDDKSQIEDVEIFVPDGQAYGVAQLVPGEWWQVTMDFRAWSAFDFGILPETSSVDAVPAEKFAAKKAKKLARNVKDKRTDPKLNEVLSAVDDIIDEIKRTLGQRSFVGLARTGKDENGIIGFTLVATLDADDVVDKIRNLINTDPDLDPDGRVRAMIDKLKGISIYLAGDIATDPLKQTLGEDININGELVLGLYKISARISGTLTGLNDLPLANGDSERNSQLTLVAASNQRNPTASRGQISMRRKGDANDGSFLLDDARHDPSTSPNFFEWQASPRRAFMYAQEDNPSINVASEIARNMFVNADSINTADGAAKKVNATSAAANFGTRSGSYRNLGASIAAATRKELLRLDGLSSMPALDSRIGSAAMNALVALADAVEDPSLLARGRRRLFPTFDTPNRAGVRAHLDWVMFRRKRSLLCCPQIPVPPVTPAIEVFQVWHLQVESEKTLKMLNRALDSNNADLLGKFSFQRVGILRYRDENTLAEEIESQVENMWQLVHPAPQVVLGRYWEQAPSTGQGWQNRLRLSEMLKQISEITTPPTSSSAITRLTAAPSPLSDGATDGGFLVVTQSTEAVTRKALLIYCHLKRIDDLVVQHYQDIESAAPRTDLVFVDNQPQGTTLANFIADRFNIGDPIKGVTMATKSAPDDGARTRLQSVLDALATAGHSLPVAARRVVEALSTLDRDELMRIEIELTEYDDIVFLEIENGV